MSRRLLMSSGGGGSLLSPGGGAAFTASGAYDPAYAPAGTLLTQLHCHTNQSDGSYSPASVVAGYLDAGYDALALTDHDTATSQPDGVSLKVPGVEESPTAQHIIAINSTYLRAGATDAQTIIDGIVAGGGQAQIAHPKWYRGMTSAELLALTDCLGFEIHNAKCVTGAGQNPVSYPGFAVDLWDQVLAGGNRGTWGFAVDDLHYVDAFNAYDVGRVQVMAESESLADLMAALVAGNFAADVSNHGVTPGWPDRDDEGVYLNCTGATRIEAWGPAGLLAAADTNALSYAYAAGDAGKYVRLVAIGGYTEPFSAALGDHWRAYDGTWTVTGGVLALTNDASTRRIILRRHREGDFTASVDMKLGSVGTDGAALMFNALTANYYYMLRIGESSDSRYNNQLAVGATTNNTFGAPVAAAAFDPDPDTWYTVKMAYTAASGRIQAKAWATGDTEPESWMIDGTNTLWRNGAFGFRANRVAQFDNLYVDGFRTYYQPIAVDAA